MWIVQLYRIYAIKEQSDSCLCTRKSSLQMDSLPVESLHLEGKSIVFTDLFNPDWDQSADWIPLIFSSRLQVKIEGIHSVNIELSYCIFHSVQKKVTFSLNHMKISSFSWPF